MPTKVCPNCGENKLTKEFYSHPATFDKLATYCKPCHYKLSRERVQRKKSQKKQMPDHRFTYAEIMAAQCITGIFSMDEMEDMVPERIYNEIVELLRMWRD